MLFIARQLQIGCTSATAQAEMGVGGFPVSIIDTELKMKILAEC